MEFFAWLRWFGDKILQIFNSKVQIDVLVHEACFTNDPLREPYYFVKIANLSYESPVTITHIWVKDESREIDILNPRTPLPYKLEKSEIWETWFSSNTILNRNNIFKNVRVVLSDASEYKSRKNLKVRPHGFISNKDLR